MQNPTDQPVLPRRNDARRVYCAGCGHSEFVHCDFDARTCLYSECRCGGFAIVAVA